MQIERIGPGEEHKVVDAAGLFDHPPRPEWTARFLASAGHHLLFAYVDGEAAGFVSGVETTHPDKGTEMFLYELGVDAKHRRQGIGSALVRALADLARDRDCYGMWVAIEADNAAAIATYRAAGGGQPEPGTTISWNFDA